MNKRKIKTLFIGALVCMLPIALSGCKSHKKAQKDSYVIMEDVLDVTPTKKKDKKGKQQTIGKRIVDEAKTWIGTPYGYGCSEKGRATDCSGMVVVIYRDVAGIKLPRVSTEQAEFCDKINENEIKAGDLVFFATGTDKKRVSHVGIMIDKEKFVHASGSKGVILSEMTTPYYRRTFIKFGRVPGLRDR
ncbi:MAG: C40 family peptidase [Muribaculaceae bacterium]|nr:C40 family peptidase [Muribaculaceae bacterium]